MDLRVVPAASYGAALQYFTGSKDHNIVVRQRAIERGLKLNEYGVFRGETLVGGATEEEVYRAVDLPWIPPELRESRREFDWAIAGTLPTLIKPADLRGDLHMHTTATDGAASIREMIEAAQARGLAYIAITDHSQRVSMANGLDAKRLRQHWAEIEAIRAEYPHIHVLKGIECDILEDATLDLDDEVLAEAEWVLAVLHYGLKQPSDQITRRLMTAIENPHVDAIGHLTGRLIGKRPPAAMDLGAVLRGMSREGKWLEINAHPARLDADDLTVAQAKDLGIPIVINSDAHSVQGFDVLKYGVHQARRGGLQAGDVMNSLPWGEFRIRLARRRRTGKGSG
jgi:DNA polymerase (family 10)